MSHRPISSSYQKAVDSNGARSLPEATGIVQPEESTPLLPRDKYSSFSTAQKTFIIFTAAFASTFSPFSSNIYYPAINSIARDLHVTPAMMNLTITAYMVS
jgi:hypothetical protein